MGVEQWTKSYPSTFTNTTNQGYILINSNSQTITFTKILKDDLRVMDMTAITLCKENNLPIQVFDIKIPGSLKQIIMGEKIGTLVSE